MARPKKFTQNINKDAGLMDLPSVYPHKSTWETQHSNYITSNIGDIVPIYVEEIVPGQKKKSLSMGMLSHMTTPKSPILNAQYTEFRSFWIPYRLCADLLNGYSTRKSPWVKVFGEDNKSTGADIIVPLSEQKLPDISSKTIDDFKQGQLEAFGGIADALDYESNDSDFDYDKINFLDMAAYELIYQRYYRNQNREAATNSDLYKFLFNAYNRNSSVAYKDAFHKANREKDYFTGSQPFTQKGDPISAGLVGTVPVEGEVVGGTFAPSTVLPNTYGTGTSASVTTGGSIGQIQIASADGTKAADLFVNLGSAAGVSIEQLRLMIKLQEELEKDAMYGSFYSQYLNSRFGCAPISLQLDEPLELKKVTITSQMQPIFQTSSVPNEESILGQIGANATTQSGLFEIVPETEFKEHGLLMICAVHKAQNSYDSRLYKSKRIFKKSRFDFYTPSLNDIGFQPVSGLEFDFLNNGTDPVSFNEGWAEYRFKFNSVHGMFQPSRENSLNFWTLAISGPDSIEALYKQTEGELNRAISVTSAVAPQFFDAYGFVEVDTKPMSLHSIPGMDGVI